MIRFVVSTEALYVLVSIATILLVLFKRRLLAVGVGIWVVASVLYFAHVFCPPGWAYPPPALTDTTIAWLSRTFVLGALLLAIAVNNPRIHGYTALLASLVVAYPALLGQPDVAWIYAPIRYKVVTEPLMLFPTSKISVATQGPILPLATYLASTVTSGFCGFTCTSLLALFNYALRAFGLIVVFLAARRIGGWYAASMAVMAFSLFPGAFFVNEAPFLETPLTQLAAAVVFSILAYIRSGNNKWIIITIVSWFLALQTHIVTFLALPFSLILAHIVWGLNKEYRVRAIHVTAILVAVFPWFAPLYRWITAVETVEHGMRDTCNIIGVLDKFYTLFFTRAEPALPVIVPQIGLLLSPWVPVAVIWAITSRPRGRALIAILFSTLMALGFAITVAAVGVCYAMLWSVIPLATIPIIASLVTAGKANRILYVIALVIFAIAAIIGAEWVADMSPWNEYTDAMNRLANNELPWAPRYVLPSLWGGDLWWRINTS